MPTLMWKIYIILKYNYLQVGIDSIGEEIYTAQNAENIHFMKSLMSQEQCYLALDF